MPQSLSFLAMTGVLLTATSVQAGLDYDEAVDGDLSGTAAAPTPVVLSGGTNSVKGTCIDPIDTRDILSFTIRPGDTLTAINLLRYDDGEGGPGNIGFLHIDDGLATVVPGFGTAGSLLGGSHVSDGFVGLDLLPFLANSPLAGSGFSLPLGPGDYSFLMQQTSTDFTAYEFEFVVESAWTDEGCALAGVAGEPLLVGSGDLSSGSVNAVDLSDTAPNALSALFLALQDTPTPFKGGTLKPVPFFPLTFLTTSPAGTLSIPFVMPAGAPAGTEVWVQFGIQDAAAPVDVALSNALLGLTP